MRNAAALNDSDLDTLERVRDSAAWKQAEADREAERAKRHRELVKERAALLRETEQTMAGLNDRHLQALGAVEEQEAKLREVKARALEAERAAWGASHGLSRRLNLIEADLRETAPAIIAEAREWARGALYDGNRGYRKQPGRRVVRDDRGRQVEVPKTEEYRAAAEHVGGMAQTERGPLWELECSDLPPAKVAERVAELKAEGERLISLAIANDVASGPVRRVVETLRRVRDVHEARAEARRAAAGEGVEAGA